MRPAFFLLAAGAALAALGDYLLRSPPGLSFPVWVAAFLFVTARASSISPLHSGLALPIMFFAGCVAWRESTFLTTANVLAVGSLCILPHVQHAGVVLRNAALSDYFGGLRGVLRHVSLGSFTYFGSELPDAVAGSPGQRRFRSVAIGVGLAVPVISVFGALFSSADPTFQRLVHEVLGVRPGWAINHALVAGIIGFICIGYLRGLLMPSPARVVAPRRFGMGTFGFTEIAIPLVGLILVCGVFVVLQLPYLFGGFARVAATADLSYATYARRGFFELTTATALVLPVLLTADRLLQHDPVTTRRFRVLALMQIVLVGVLMASALQRMGLYWTQYGLTTARLYATSFMLWIASVFVWFGLTVLQNRRHRFAFGSLVSGLVMLAALNFGNPDAVITRVNLARALTNQPIDGAYLSSLSTDAYPFLSEHMGSVPQASRCQVLASMRSRVREGNRDWRGWTVSRYRARVALGHIGTRNWYPCPGLS